LSRRRVASQGERTGTRGSGTLDEARTLVASAQTARLEVIAHWNIGMSDAFFSTQVFPPR